MLFCREKGESPRMLTRQRLVAATWLVIRRIHPTITYLDR